VDGLGKAKADLKVACFGLAFKPDVDDFRESPAVHVVEMLAEEGFGSLLVVDPYLEKLPRTLEGKITPGTMADALEGADISVVLVDHKEFKQDFRPSGVVIDTKGIVKGNGNA
jgi:UDP-N-acetyl-D-mannosaminuronic acid dehydrogenase